MTESVQARLRRTITDMTRFEIDLQKALRRALEKWQPTVLAAVQDPAAALTAAGELDGLSGTVAAWEAIVHDDLLPEIERLMAAHILEEYERHGILDELPEPPDPDSGLIVGTVRDAIAGGIPAGVAALVYAAPGVREFQAGYLASVSNRMVRTPDTLFDRLRVVLDASFREGEGARDRANRLESIIREGEWWEHRAITVARTEAVGAYNAAHLEVARLRAEEYGEEAMEKVWSCTLDGRTRDSHFAADGQRAPLDGTFRVGSSRLRFPGDPDGPAEEIINCRCALMELLPGEEYPETDRHTERTETQSTVKNRDGSQEDEIRRREERGVTRALDDDDGIGSVQAAATTTEGTTSMTTTEWGGVLAPLGKPTGDGRQFAPDADVATRELPLPLMWQKQTSDLPHSQAFTVGSIRTLEVRDGAIHATGILFDTEEGREAAEQIREGVTRPSVDLCDDVYRLVTEDGEEVTEEEWWDMIDEDGGAEDPPTLIMEFTSFTVMAATLVAKPAFAEARLEIVEEGSAGEDPDPDADPDSADEEDAEESVSASAATPEELALLASAAPAQKVYADAMFHDPQLREPTPLHMTEDGRIVGHLALWKDCHMGVGNACVTPPASRTGYALFHVSEVPTDSGPLAVGRLTVGGGHADPKLGVQPTIEHYDDAGAAFALVRAGEDAHGIWVSGIPAPHATDAQVQLGLSSPLSGDWRRHGGNLELVAALSVNTPGFPVPRGSRDDKGRDYALVAAGALPPATSAPLGKRGGASLQTVIDASVKASVTAALAAFREESTREAREAAVRRRVAAIEERQEEYTRRRMGNLRRAHAERLAARKGVN